jgi:hypothetical protein
VALLDQVRDAFGVDDEVHQGCVDQVGSMVDALDAELVVNLSGLSVTVPIASRNDATGAVGSVLAMVEAVAPDTAEVSSKRALAKKLCKAVAAVANSGPGSSDLANVRSLLTEGADPNLDTGRRGSAMSIAAELKQPALTTLLVEKGGDPSLERNSRRALSRWGGSSGVFETVPVELDGAVACFPDEFMVPIPGGGSGGGGGASSAACVRVEFWRINASLPSTSHRGSSPGSGGGGVDQPGELPPGGKRKKVRRGFFRSRSKKARDASQRDGRGADDEDDQSVSPAPQTRIVIEKGGGMIEFLGAVRLDVGSLALGKPQVVKLGGAAAGAEGGLKAEVTVQLLSDLTEIRRKRRKQHQDVLAKLVVASAREFWFKSSNRDQVCRDRLPPPQFSRCVWHSTVREVSIRLFLAQRYSSLVLLKPDPLHLARSRLHTHPHTHTHTHTSRARTHARAGVDGS